MSDTKHTQIGRLIKKGSLAGYIDFGKIVANSPRAKLMLAAPDLLEACKGLFGLVQSGSLVRDISKDGETDFALRQLPLVKALKHAQEAIEKASTQ